MIKTPVISRANGQASITAVLDFLCHGYEALRSRFRGLTKLRGAWTTESPFSRIQANLEVYLGAISADGRLVTLYSWATNLVPGDTNESVDFFVHDRQTHQTIRVNVDSGGNQANGSSYSYPDRPTISADGRFVAFNSAASNLVPEDTQTSWDIFVHDRRTHETTRVNIDSAGNPGNSEAYSPAISADGRFVTFYSSASDLVSGDTNSSSDVFVRDRLLDRTATADIGVTQTVSPSPFPASSPITYTITVANHGPDAAKNVTLVDGPLRGAAVPSQGSCSTGAPMVCYLGNLAAGASATVTLTLPPRSTGTTRVYNGARVNAAPVDPNVANNKTGLHTDVAP